MADASDNWARLTTDAMPPPHRAAYLADEMGRRLSAGHIETDPQRPVRADWRLTTLGPQAVLGHVEQTNLVAARDPGLTRDGDADVSLFLMAAGEGRLEQNDRRVVLRGGGVFVAHARPVRSAWHDAKLLVLRLPRGAFAGVGGLDAAGGLALAAGSPRLRLLRAYAEALGAEAPPPFAAAHLGELAAAALAESLGRSDATGPEALAAARLSAMRAAMAARLAEPGLNMAAVSAAAGISPRAGYALFEAAGLRFEETLYAMRLDRAMLVLSSGGDPKLLPLALQLGFADLSHFNRRFRARFGRTPGEARAAGIAANGRTAGTP